MRMIGRNLNGSGALVLVVFVSVEEFGRCERSKTTAMVQVSRKVDVEQSVLVSSVALRYRTFGGRTSRPSSGNSGNFCPEDRGYVWGTFLISPF